MKHMIRLTAADGTKLFFPVQIIHYLYTLAITACLNINYEIIHSQSNNCSAATTTAHRRIQDKLQQLVFQYVRLLI